VTRRRSWQSTTATRTLSTRTCRHTLCLYCLCYVVQLLCLAAASCSCACQSADALFSSLSLSLVFSRVKQSVAADLAQRYNIARRNQFLIYKCK